MRSSRVSRDTAKVFERVSSPPSTPPRRATRSSLARFSYAAATTTTTTTTATTPDIEDSIPDQPSVKRRKVAPSAASRTTTIKTTVSPAKTIKSELVEDALFSLSSPGKSPRRQRKPARKTTDPTTGEITVAPPSDWEEMYDTVRKMRSPTGQAYPAAVDTMGCERLADLESSPRDQRFHTLVALMLSSQTKDTVNAVAMRRLQTEMPGYEEGVPNGLTLENMLAVDPAALNQMIWAVGFHNNKTKFVPSLRNI